MSYRFRQKFIRFGGLLLIAALAWQPATWAEDESLDAELVAPPKPDDWGMPARGGEFFDTAEPLEFNMDYLLLTALEPDSPVYFSVNGEAAVALTAELRTRPTADEKKCGISVGAISLGLLDVGGQPLRSVEVGAFGKWQRSEVYRPSTAADYYARFNSATEQLPPDCLQFKISAAPLNTEDLEGGDAGGDFATAVPIDYEYYSDNHLGGDDTEDGYSFYALKLEQYAFQVDFEEPGPERVDVDVLDEDHHVIYHKTWEAPASAVTEVFQIPHDGHYMVLLRLPEASLEIYPYAFKLTLVKTRQERLKEIIQERRTN